MEWGRDWAERFPDGLGFRVLGVGYLKTRSDGVCLSCKVFVLSEN